jgi:hypothetical protein
MAYQSKPPGVEEAGAAAVVSEVCLAREAGSGMVALGEARLEGPESEGPTDDTTLYTQSQ